jgi:hypothetical protein
MPTPKRRAAIDGQAGRRARRGLNQAGRPARRAAVEADIARALQRAPRLRHINVANLRAAATAIHHVVGGRARNHITIAITQTDEGRLIISSSEPRLTPAQIRLAGRLFDPDRLVFARGRGHAEVTGVRTAERMHLTPVLTVASRPICGRCAPFLRDHHVELGTRERR